MTQHEFHPLVKQLLDGELTIAELPPELRREGEEALALLAAVDRAPVQLPGMTKRVMARTRRRFTWVLAPALAAAAALVVWFARPAAPAPDSVNLVAVRFVLVAPEARQVSVAGTFNQWDANAAPLVRSDNGVWTATITLPAGQHQYAFVVDGGRWVPDPSAPAVSDGFGRRNSILAL